MGLYDSVTVRLPLPDKEAQGLVFQTKDLGSNLDMYLVDEAGRLVRQTEDAKPRGFTFYSSTVEGMWYEYYATLTPEGTVEKIERVYAGPTAQRWTADEITARYRNALQEIADS